MQDGLVGRLGLAISLGMRHGREASLAAQVVEVARELASVTLLAIAKDYGTRDAEPGNYATPYEFTHLSSGYRCDSLGFDLFGEVVHRHKKVLALDYGFVEKVEDVHPSRGK